MSQPVAFWAYAELIDGIQGPYRVTDADGVSHVVTGSVGFVDYPQRGGGVVARLGVRGKIVGAAGGMWRVRFAGGAEGNFAWLSPCQVEYAKAEPKTAA